MKTFTIAYECPWDHRVITHRGVPQCLLRDIDGETYYVGYAKRIEVITATLETETGETK
tara:strand:+ start:264 stop:440 length:177 start_codon:yes stop_codon:yes gene_type:complete